VHFELKNTIYLDFFELQETKSKAAKATYRQVIN